MINLEQFKTNIMIHETKIMIPDMFHDKIEKIISNFNEKIQEKRQSIKYYSNFRNTTENKAGDDITYGKYGEILAYYWLKQNGFPKVKPDFTVFTGKDKSWDADLPFKNKDPLYPNCHVKTCTDYTKQLVGAMGGYYSWTFQFSNNDGIGGKDNLFSGQMDDDIVVLVYLDRKNKFEGDIIASSPWTNLKPLLKDPIKKDKRGCKKCIYFSSLQKHENE